MLPRGERHCICLYLPPPAAKTTPACTSAAPSVPSTSTREQNHGRKSCNQRVRADRAQRSPRHHRERPHRHPGRRHQRPRPGRDQRPPDALRQRARPFPRRSESLRRHDRCRSRSDQGDRHPQPRGVAAQGPRRRDRAGVHGFLHVEGHGVGPSHRWRQARPHLGARRRRRPDRRLRRQSRQAGEGPPRHLECLVHDELPGARRQGAERRRRHREGIS